MLCSACGKDNPDAARFCRSCGSALKRRCAQCGQSLDPGDIFCFACGAKAQPDAAPASRETAAVQSVGAPIRIGAPAPAPQPTSFANGRYVVKRFLGEGGKKKVFLAHDELLDRDVAFAIIKTEALDEVARTRITREAQAMGRLGSHPHIVTVFDLGQHDGQPFMVTELMGGGDVEGLIEKTSEHRLPLERAVSIAIQTCRGLDFAHRKGIVHRDLKPGNVWLTADGTAKVGDFGLAVALDRSRLTQEGMMVGTVAYMPPEQAMGGEVTPRADLYSLGAMLYEMVCGRPPFLGDDPVAIIGQHINTAPVAPTWHNPQCPKPLEALILRLLAKNPDERPESASDLLSALEAIDPSPADVGALRPVGAPQGDAHALEGMSTGVFVGRQREMGELKAALEEALSGRGRLVMLVGEPGIGKTRTAEELATYAGLRGCQALWGRCHEGRGAPPYWPWVQAIRSYAREKEPAQLRIEMGSGAADIAEVVSDVRERLPDLKPSPKLDDPEQARFRLFDSITAFLKSASRKQPLVVILDNLHWADKPSLLLIEFLAPELTGSRLLVIGTYRDVDLSRKHPLTETLGELTKERLFQRVLLRGLSEDDVGRFIEFVSGIRPPAGLVKAVHQQTEGNPLFMTEVVRLLVQEGELTQERVKDRDSWSVRIPEGVREVIGRRLNRLSARCNEALTIAAMIGREFELRQLRRLVEDTSEDRLLEVLEEALSARLIEELPRVVGRYQFSHALVRQTLEEELSTTRRVRLHARVAEALEESYGGNADAHASELAYHFAEAESVLGTEKLVKYSTLAGEQALARYAYEDALAHFQRALAAKEGEPMDAETAGLWFGLGRAQLATRTLEEMHITLASLTRAFDYYASVNDVERAVAVAGLLLPGGNPRGWGDLIARALKLVAPDSHEAGRLLANHGVIIGNFSPNYQGAQEAFSLALAIARREGDIALEVQTLANASLVDWRHMRWQDSLAKGLRVIELTRRASNPPSEMRARTAIIQSLRTMGKLTEAKTHAAAQLATAEKVRERQWLLRALENNTEIAILEGDFQAARIISERRLGTGSRYQMGLSVRALLEYQLGEFAQAQAYFARMRELLTSVEPVSVSPIAMSVALAGRITEDSSYLQVAESIAQDLLNTSRRDPHATHHCKTALALIAIQRDNPDAAGEQYEAIKDIPGIMIWIGAQSDHVLGLLAHTMGQLNKAAEHFEDALAFCRKAGYRPELAWSLCDYADVLRERASTGSAQASPGDRQKAMSLLDESLRISRELGMRPLMERVLSRREILKA